MIALIDLFSFVFVVIALGLSLTSTISLSRKVHLVLLLLLLLTGFINAFSTIEWFKSSAGLWTKLLTGSEMFHDYLQPLQAALWIGLIHLLIKEKS